MKIVKRKLGELILDYSIYPRTSVDSQSVGYMVEALRAGHEFPPVVIDAKSKRVVDGFHRVATYRRAFGDNHEIECIEKKYADEKALFADSIRYNSGHGRRLDTHDRVHCLILAEKIGLAVEDVAGALNMTVDAVGELRVDRVGEMRVNRVTEPVPLKRTIRHMAGKPLNKAQVEANDRLSGMTQLFYVNQVILLLENDLLEKDNENLAEALRRLGQLIDQAVGVAA